MPDAPLQVLLSRLHIATKPCGREVLRLGHRCPKVDVAFSLSFRCAMIVFAAIECNDRRSLPSQRHGHEGATSKWVEYYRAHFLGRETGWRPLSGPRLEVSGLWILEPSIPPWPRLDRGMTQGGPLADVRVEAYLNDMSCKLQNTIRNPSSSHIPISSLTLL